MFRGFIYERIYSFMLTFYGQKGAKLEKYKAVNWKAQPQSVA